MRKAGGAFLAGESDCKPFRIFGDGRRGRSVDLPRLFAAAERICGSRRESVKLPVAFALCPRFRPNRTCPGLKNFLRREFWARTFFFLPFTAEKSIARPRSSHLPAVSPCCCQQKPRTIWTRPAAGLARSWVDLPFQTLTSQRAIVKSDSNAPPGLTRNSSENDWRRRHRVTHVCRGH